MAVAYNFYSEERCNSRLSLMVEVLSEARNPPGICARCISTALTH